MTVCSMVPCINTKENIGSLKPWSWSIYCLFYVLLSFAALLGCLICSGPGQLFVFPMAGLQELLAHARLPQVRLAADLGDAVGLGVTTRPFYII